MHADLPVLNTSIGRVPLCEGWTLEAKLTICVVDGPGDSGCLVQAATTPQELDQVTEWLRGVEVFGGAVVVSAPAVPNSLEWETVVSSGMAHGGIIRSANRG